MNRYIPFKTADILIPKSCDMSKWSVVACDQYTSEPEYWNAVTAFVGNAPSTLKITLPEIYLEESEVDDRVCDINKAMFNYISEDFFTEVKDSFILLKRKLADGKIRLGIIGVVDLEKYDYLPQSTAEIRATEGTVLERIPPRVRIRKDAPLELPHIMLLIDDPNKIVIEPLAEKASSLEKVYDFTLMQNSGSVEGYRICGADATALTDALTIIADNFEKANNGASLLFAVGDGNHSLATAKTCFENLKATVPEEIWKNHPARYALVEVVNLHDSSLDFEPIHRVLFDVTPDFISALKNNFAGAVGGKKIEYNSTNECGEIDTGIASTGLVVDAVQKFVDKYISEHGCRVDYVHGDDVTRSLGKNPGNASILLPKLDKSELFPSIATNGVFPRKTFSMGHACDKRFYLECRKIK